MSNLIIFYDKVTHLVDQGRPVDVIFLNFRKAFDTVSYRILLGKMSSIELNEQTHVMGEQLAHGLGNRGLQSMG